MNNKVRIVAACVILAAFASSCGTTSDWSFKDGDIVFQTSLSGQSVAIEKATHSRYSHMGVIVFKDSTPFVFEAVKTVRYTPLDDWIERGEDGHFVVKRLRETEALSALGALTRFREIADMFEGKPYDLTFEWTDDRIYCSELVWKIYKRALDIEVGGLQKLKDFDLEHVAVKDKLRERYGDAVPFEEIVISPGEMYSSSLLMTVFEN